ncbi:hypothetical protein [Hoeflea marina]|nr:hypothetical protein [Hoeflea marina]
MSEPYIVIYHETERGFEYDREGYDLPELAGTIPVIGDYIVNPGVARGADRMLAENHTVYEVVRRYFKPRTSPNYGARVVLVVKARSGAEEEADLLSR